MNNLIFFLLQNHEFARNSRIQCQKVNHEFARITNCGITKCEEPCINIFFSDLLSTQEPILLTAEKIPDEIYWQRCCQDLLTSYDSARHGGSYKRLFLEKHLQSCIEKFIPQQTDLFDIKDLLGVMEPYIKRLEVTELLPPTLILVSITFQVGH